MSKRIRGILKIELTKKESWVEEVPADIFRQYIGGRGLGAYLLYQLVPAHADPLGPDNHVIFTAGLPSGSDLYYSSKVCMTTKSPLTGLYLASISGSTLGHEMAKAGLCAIDISGVASSPTYLVIENQRVEFRNAEEIWGMETAAGQQAMFEKSATNTAATVSIGPAGEKLVRFAAVFSQGDLYRCWGRGGGGAVMGSKNLKGFVVKGDGEIKYLDRAKFEEVKNAITGRLKNEGKPWADRWRRYETGADLKLLNQEGLIPTKNWQYGQFDSWAKLDKSTTPKGWPEVGRACGPYCPTPGCRLLEITEGPYKGAESDIEWESIYAFGSTCGVDKIEAVVAANQICDEFGVDIMTAGVTIGFLMECFEKGLIGLTDTDGIDLRFGNDAAMIASFKKMAAMEGFGLQIIKGVKRLSETIRGSEAFAMHVKGLELGGYECRGFNGQALEFAICPMGGHHHAYGLPARKEIMDGSRLKIAGKGQAVKEAAIDQICRDSLTMCSFPKQVIQDKFVVNILSAFSEHPWSEEEVNAAGERIMCMERLFNVREGMTRKDDSLPPRLLNEPKPDGPNPGATVPLEELKDDFYATMGYDPITGNPTLETIQRLGIKPD